MPQFGIEASGISEPQAAGSTPHGGVVTQQIRTDPWAAIAANGRAIGSVVAGIGGLFDKDKVNPVLAELSKSLTGFSSARNSGAISGDEAKTRAQAAVTKALGDAGGDVELTKQIKANFDAFAGTTGVVAKDDTADFQKTLDQNVILELQKRGFPVIANPSPELMDSYRSAYATLQSSADKLSRETASLSAAKAKADFTEDLQKKAFKESVNSHISTNLPSMTDTLGKTAKDFKAKIDAGQIKPDQAIQAIKALGDKFRGELQMAAPASPDYVASTMSYLSSVEKNLVDSLDPKVSAESLNNQLNAQIASDRLFLSTNADFRALQAIQPYVANNPNMFIPLGQVTMKAMPQLVSSINNVKGTGIKLSDMPTEDKKDLLSFGKNAIKTATGELQAVQAGTSKLDPKITDNIVNNLLIAGANVPPEEKASASKDYVAFLASPEFKVWRQRGQLNAGALKAAQNMFDNVYIKNVQIPINDKLLQDIPMRQNATIGNNGLKVTPNYKYKDVLNVEMNGGILQFSPKKIEGMDVLQLSQAGSFNKEVKNLQQIVNTLITAGANVRGVSNEEYWKENKTHILPTFFPPDSKNLKIGDVVNGYVYLGGAVKSSSSWEKANAGEQ